MHDLSRRSFIGSILAASCAPAIVKAGVLMPVRKIIVPEPWPMEIGSVERFRFIESPALLYPGERLTLERMRRLKADLIRHAMPVQDSVWISEPSPQWNDQLRRQTEFVRHWTLKGVL